MSKSKAERIDQSAAKAAHSKVASRRRGAWRFFGVRRLGGALVVFLIIFAVGCRRDMQDQPRIKPLRGSSFFTNGLASRQPITGTIPRGYLRDDKPEFYTGKKSRPGEPAASATPAQQQTAGGAQQQQVAGAQQNSFPDDVEEIPIPVTKEIVQRGQERYNIFCSACHGMTGNGDGMIVRRGFRRAASFNDDRLRQAPVGHFFDAMTNGWGAMPAYAPQIPVQDRWAIVAYIRALQLSQQNPNAAASASPAPSPSPTPAAGGHQ
ncbi:MAG TPA: cytochrome c [Pyrinomonadaceae bacterium]|nr:cytochrome c [Pyrinomonadaceae bacterium]